MVRGMSWYVNYLANTLRRKYGVLGRVAARYVKAGFSVRVLKDVVVAQGRGVKYVITAAENPKEAVRLGSRVIEVAGKLGGVPVVALYGRARWGPIIGELRGIGVRVKLVRG